MIVLIRLIELFLVKFLAEQVIIVFYTFSKSTCIVQATAISFADGTVHFINNLHKEFLNVFSTEHC